MAKIWHKSGSKDDLISDRITVYEGESFILSLSKDDYNSQEMQFEKDEMEEIYNFLKQYYE